MITAEQLKPNILVKLQNGTTFLIESVTSDTVISSLENGTKGNYKTELNDAIAFFNENKAIIL